MTRRLLGATLLLFWGTGIAAAQSYPEPDEVRSEVNVAWAVPQGAFDDRIDGTGLGLTAFFGGRVPNAPIVLGTELGLLNYGAESAFSLHGTEFSAGVITHPGVPLEAVHVESTNNILMGHLVVRLQPAIGPLELYADVLGGVRYFFTRTEVESDVVVFEEGIDLTSNSKDLALSYGFGGGIEVVMIKQRFGLDERPATVSLHAGARYLFGEEAEYAREGLVRDDGSFLLRKAETRTDMLLPHFGIRVRR